MMFRQGRGSPNGTYVTRRAGKGPHAMRTIVTPAGSFRTISKDVFDRAVRSANTALKQSGSRRDDAPSNARER